MHLELCRERENGFFGVGIKCFWITSFEGSWSCILCCENKQIVESTPLAEPEGTTNANPASIILGGTRLYPLTSRRTKPEEKVILRVKCFGKSKQLIAH
ncbi:glucose-1-phosphate adenylyltransferase large subunit 2, chloroplastic/amyloplastic-like isoform X2 [Salvia divinorum]|uniref:Glucose-1-phosphate adenylyltransferase large subunit 2, chloroplastic/amyloplastic-like isoform X2 n=1 Tax=Salvia divinorum TaxID=28513 RepID=A0ABD1G927_SALDI